MSESAVSLLSPEEQARYQNPDTIRTILQTARTVAVVGLSSDITKASYQVAAYLQAHGYRIVPVNPTVSQSMGERCWPSLKAIPFPVDVVDVFRPAADCGPIVDQAIAIGAPAVWLQLGIVNREAGEKALAAGMKIVMDRCMKIEHQRSSGD